MNTHSKYLTKSAASNNLSEKSDKSSAVKLKVEAKKS